MAVDFCLVIPEFEFPSAQLSVPGDHHRFHSTFAEFGFAASEGLRHVIKLLDAGAHCAQNEEQRFGIGIDPLLSHIEIRCLDVVKARQLAELLTQAASGFCSSCRIPVSGIRSQSGRLFNS